MKLKLSNYGYGNIIQYQTDSLEKSIQWHTNLDVEKFYSVQRIEQNTTFYDFLGDNLADYLLDTILPTAVSAELLYKLHS